MDAGPVYATSPWSRQFAEQLSEKEFRDEYMMDQVRTNIAFQIRALREQPCRQWTQAELAGRADTTQSVISRIENPDYGSMTPQTLLEVAAAFDLPLLVQFVEWEDWLQRMSDVSPAALAKRSFNLARLVALANLRPRASLLDDFIKPQPAKPERSERREQIEQMALNRKLGSGGLSDVPYDPRQPQRFQNIKDARDFTETQPKVRQLKPDLAEAIQ
jgi:transcriptional regulator with XRE-family HTH domain